MTSADVANITWLTQEAFDRLQREHDALVDGRTEISAKIEAAREEGDLKENGGYHAAKEEQGKQEARIRQLADMLRRAEVGESPTDVDTVAPGVQVTVAFFGDESDTDTFVLGSRELLGLDEAVDSTNVYSPQSPLGAAILGKRKGDSASYDAPNGKAIEVTIVAVEPFKS